MRVIVIVDDQFMEVDGVQLLGVDMSDLIAYDDTIRAVQWEGTTGEMEVLYNGNRVVNIPITNIAFLDATMAKFTQRYNELDPTVTETLNDVVLDKEFALRKSCETAILNTGLMCDALGQMYMYPMDRDSQTNLTGCVTESLLTTDPNWTAPFWCMNVATGHWDRIQHTIAQMQAVGLAGAQYVRNYQNQLKTKFDAVDTIANGTATEAQKKAAIKAVNW